MSTGYKPALGSGSDDQVGITGLPTYEAGWRDLVSPFNRVSLGGSAPTLTTLANGVRLYRFSSGDSVHSTYHVDHDYQQGSNAYHHVHWFSDAAMNPGDTVTWRISYVLARGHHQGDSLLNSRVVQDITLVADGSEIAGEHLISEMSDLQAYNILEPDTTVLAEIELLSKTTSGNIFGLQADLHYLTDTVATVGKKPDFDVPD